MSKLGIDVSDNQGYINWEKVNEILNNEVEKSISLLEESINR